MKKCELCDEWHFPNLKGVYKHDCKEFTVIDEYGDEYYQRGEDEEDAALKYAKSYNEDDCEYSLMNESIIITVNGKKFKISAEPDINYLADEIEGE